MQRRRGCSGPLPYNGSTFQAKCQPYFDNDSDSGPSTHSPCVGGRFPVRAVELSELELRGVQPQCHAGLLEDHLLRL